MFKSIRCMRKGHMFVDSRSTPGTQVCVRCRHRRPFESLEARIKPLAKDNPDPCGALNA